jgi:YHS domain-containing protein
MMIIMISFFLLPGFWIFGGGKTEDSGQGVLVDSEGVAAGGADVVAYHDLGEGEPAVMGSAENSVRWQGATWLFSSSENAGKFEENPERYAPQYGGYCAYAMADGKTVKIDPDSWSIRDGKLYLNYDAGVQKKWLAKVSDYIRRADDKWPATMEKLKGGR